MIKYFDEFVNEAYKYSPKDFDLTIAPEELIQYVIDNVDDFGKRYQHALAQMDKRRVPLRLADNSLYDEIYDAMCDWCEDNDKDVDEYDIDEIF